MIVPFSISDFLDRAVRVYGERIGVVDEPDQPAPALGNDRGELTYAEIGELARRRAAPPRRARHRGRGAGGDRQPQQLAAADVVLRRRGLRPGPGAGELPAAPPRGAVHRRALAARGCCYVDPELDESLAAVEPASTGPCSAPTTSCCTPRPAPSPRRGRPDENATATINYTSGTTARPKGVQITHRNIWVNATDVRVARRGQRPRRLPAHAPDVPLQRLGLPFAVDRAWARTQVVLRKIDGAEILRGASRSTASPACAPRPAVVSRRCSTAAQAWDGPSPGRGTGCGSSSPAPRRRPGSSSGSRPSSGWEFIQIYGLTETSPLLTDQPQPRRVGRPQRRRAGQRSWSRRCAGARRHAWSSAPDGEVLARGERRPGGLLGPARGDRPRRSRTAGSTPATAATIDDDGYVTIQRPQEGRHHHRRRERRPRSRWRTRCSATPASPRSPSSACPSEKWGETIKALVVLAPGAPPPRPT